MSFPRYPRYKPSGSDWLGEVPENWRVKKFRYLFRESSEKIESEVVGPMLSVSGYRGIEVKEYDDENRRRLDEDLIGYRIVRVGQLVVNTMWLNYAGLGVSDHEGHVSPAYRSYGIDPELERRFVHHLLRSGTYVKGYTRLLTGVRPNSLQMSREDLMNFPVIVPPRAEQTRIAEFLDRETEKIDGLVAEQQRLMELLKEKRQAVIFHAVTHGLNPKAPLKPSGIEWLGDIPAHWGVAHLNRLVQPGRRITYGIVQPGERDERGRYMVRGQDYSFGWANPETLFKVSDAIEIPYRRARLKAGDLVMTIVGAGVGNIAVVPNWLEGANLTQTTARIAVDPNKADSRFVASVLQSPIGRRSVEFYAKGAAQPGLNIEHVRVFPITIPPLEEQRIIAAYIDQETSQFDTLATETQRAIDLLQERRTALISAAVTGQIDVRES